MPRCCHSMPVRQRGAEEPGGSRLRTAASPKLCREPDGRRPPAAPGGGRAGGARAGGACGTAGPAARVPAPCRDFPRGCPPLAEARKNGAVPDRNLPQARNCAGSRTAAGRPPPPAAGARAEPAPAVRGTAGPAARVPAPCRGFPRGRLPHTQARKKRGALRLPRKCDQILMPSSAILSRSERKSAKPFWVLAGLRSSAAGWKVPIIQTPFFSAHSPCWRVTL